MNFLLAFFVVLALWSQIWRIIKQGTETLEDIYHHHFDRERTRR